MILFRITLIVVLAGLPLACGDKKKPSTKSEPATASVLAPFELKVDPGEALAVVDAVAAAPKDDVVAVGRIGNIVKGFATFNLVDKTLDYCGAGGAMDNCATPWDYCCIAADEKAAHTLVVEVHGDNGEVLEADSLPGLRLLDLVVVKGKIQKDEHGNATILATGWYRRERPKLRDGLNWPE
ncbi:MAG: hypothetical protein O7E54_14080 [Planctomycetota bacterium]|nr:hypothetical protein [Planctomycetota bacterium]